MDVSNSPSNVDTQGSSCLANLQGWPNSLCPSTLHVAKATTMGKEAIMERT